MKLMGLLLLLLLACPAYSQYHNDPIPEHETFTIQSQHLGELRTINVWTPPGYETGSEPLPVLYMPDGGIEEDFPHIANTLAELIKAKKIEPVILVGIENTQRRRDLSGPTEVEEDREIAPVVGGSEQFRAFINNELFAEINKRYRTTCTRGIIGESLAGLFVVETLFLKPEMFDFYIAFDPSLWWNDKYLLRNADEYLASFPTNQKTFWFAGSQVEGIFENTARLADILKAKNIENLRWEYSPELNEDHGSIFRAAKEKALVWSLNEETK